MRKIAGITLLAFFCTITSFAQSERITGKIVDKIDDKPIAGAIVSLLKQKDSSIVVETVSSATGTFFFDKILPDSLILKINSLNYQEYISFFNSKNGSKTLSTIKLEAQGKNLATVTVKSKIAPVVVKGDTAQFSASQYKVNPDATTEDLIKKMPGISVAKDGTVTAQGETVKKVTIDGKDFFGDDASAALKNINAEAVDKIQVFDRLSDQARLTGFDDGNSTKAINIVTKASVKNGQFGRLYAGAGTDDRYSAGGNASFFKDLRKLSIVGSFNNINQQNFASQDLLGLTSGSGNNSGGGRGGFGGGGPQGGGRGGPGGGMGGGNDFNVGQANGISKTNAIGINFSNEYNKKLTVAGSYFYNQSRNNNQSIVNTETFLQKKDTSLFSKQNSNSNTNNTNHRINLRLEYNFDSSNSLFFIPSINFQKNNAISFTDVNSYFGASGIGKLFDTANTSISKNIANRDGYNIRNSLLFRHAFAKKGRSISFGLNHNITKNNSESTSDADYRYFKNNLLVKDSLQNQLYDNVSTGNTIGGTIAYTEPIGKKSQLQFDYNPSVQKSKADQQTFAFDGQKYSQFDTMLSNKFDNIITTNNAGLTYRFVPGKEQLFQIGVSYQTTKLESNRTFPSKTNVNQSFSNFLPNLIFRRKLAKYSNIRIFYRASTNFPSVTQLQDVINLANPLRVSAGNPLLQQSYTQFLGSRFSYTNTKTTNSFFIGFFVQTANDYITNATFIPTADSTIQNGIELKKGTQLTKPLNLNGYRSARSFLTYSMPLKFIKTILNLNAGFTYQRLPGQINTTAILTNNAVYNAGFSLASNISEYIDYNISYAANFSQTNSSVSGANNFVNQVAGLQINLLSKKGWFIQNDISYQTNTGLSAGFNQKFGIWNAAIGRKFLKKNAGELKLSVFDLLKQNQSISRTIDARYIEDAQSVVLQQYFMLTFTYSLKNFGKAKPSTKADNKEEINRIMQPR
jgi:Outer membrane protein beta-barrel family